jgi:serine/threonine protein kinase
MADLGFHGHGNKLHKFTFFNEIQWLDLLKDTKFTPILVSYDESLLTIEMTYVGRSITSTTIPLDWELQCKHIISTLKSYNCSHNDIKPEDILVYENKLYLVDFGWATRIDLDIPSFFPKTIGGDFKSKSVKFDDEYSLISSIKYVLENE